MMFLDRLLGGARDIGKDSKNQLRYDSRFVRFPWFGQILAGVYVVAVLAVLSGASYYAYSGFEELSKNLHE